VEQPAADVDTFVFAISAPKPGLSRTKLGRSSFVDVGVMTNQLTYTDTTTSTTVQRPTRTITSTSDDQLKRPSGGRGWILIAGGAALAVAAVVGFAATGNDPTEPAEPNANQRPAYLIVQDEIDAALAEQSSAADLNVQRPTYLIIQDEIDKALAERNGVSQEQRPTAQIVQDEIDAALAEQSSAADLNVL
jgi:hypothetical protein